MFYKIKPRKIVSMIAFIHDGSQKSWIVKDNFLVGGNVSLQHGGLNSNVLICSGFKQNVPILFKIGVIHHLSSLEQRDI